ncbi:Uncharacterised protein [uncultured archaeon]|nr:Uncharacterised protein [uncultured archaeon]
MRLMLSWLVLVVLLGTAAVSPVYADTVYTGAFIQNNESLNCDTCSNNTSGLQVKERTVFAQAPKIITIGKGYYADHPIIYNSQTGKQTWVKSKATSGSMNHEVSSAHNLSQTLDMSAQDRSHQDEYGMTANGGVQMKVAEDVQEGKVSIGVLQGGKPWNGQSPSATALRNPLLDIEEDYVGNFRIENNMTLQAPILRLSQNYSWLPCCSGNYFDVPDHNNGYIGEKSVFDYRR